MAHSIRSMLLTLTVLTILSLVRSAQAQIPYTSTETGNYLITPTGPNTIHGEYTGLGNSSPGGAYTSFGAFDLDTTDPANQIASNATFNQDYGGGNTLFGTFTGTATFTSATEGTFTLDSLLTGGTGTFLNYRGTFTVTGTLNVTGPTTIAYTAIANGTLVVIPEPGAVALLIGASVPGTMLLLRHRKVHR
jgi:hypothetical protein